MIENCAIATMDGPRHDQGGAEYRSGHVTVTGDRITAVGEGPAASVPDGARRIDAAGCLATPGLVNTHHHLYQWLTQGRAQQSVLFDWLTELYPVWARIDAGQVHAAATAGLAWLALSGCTTSTDHHYIFPREALRAGGDADALAAEVAAAARVGLRFHPCRGSMDLGRSAGGLPPDEIVEDTDAALAATEEAVRRFHDPSPGAMVRVAAAPCSPFSVSPRLMRETADLARGLGVRMHTHLAETREEDAYCRQALGRTPAEYAEDLGWLGPDVWLAHCVHLDEAAVRRFAATGTSVAHCPTSNARLGAGIAPVRDLLAGRGRGRPGRGRRRLERGQLAGRRAAPGPARRAGQGRARAVRADRAAGAVARHPRRGPLPGPGRRDRRAAAGHAGRYRAVAARRPRARRDRRTAPAATRSRPWCSGRPPRSSSSWSAARRWWTAANCAPSTPPRPPARSGRPGSGWPDLG